VTDAAAALPKSFTLFQNRPNPTNAGTEITYTLLAPSMTELTVYNLLGMKVARLVNELQAAGPHRVVWDGRTSEGLEAPSGVYFYRLTASGQSETRKMLLLR
jgi:flagellar hook assembly protein FlgD